MITIIPYVILIGLLLRSDGIPLVIQMEFCKVTMSGIIVVLYFIAVGKVKKVKVNQIHHRKLKKYRVFKI